MTTSAFRASSLVSSAASISRGGLTPLRVPLVLTSRLGLSASDRLIADAAPPSPEPPSRRFVPVPIGLNRTAVALERRRTRYPQTSQHCANSGSKSVD